VEYSISSLGKIKKRKVGVNEGRLISFTYAIPFCCENMSIQLN
jgi:hypothetical protein